MSNVNVIPRPLEFVFPDGLVSRYATNLVVQHTDHEFIISFFEAQPPVILGSTDEERKAQIERIEAVRAECVARIIIAAERMPEFVRTLQGNLDQYRINFGKAGDKE